MEITRRIVSNQRVIGINGELDMGNVKDLKAVFDAEIAQGARQIIVDMRNLTYIDSSGIGAFIAVMNKLRQVNGNITLMAIQPEVMRIFQMTKLTSFFKIINGEADIASSSAPAAAPQKPAPQATNPQQPQRYPGTDPNKGGLIKPI